RNAGRSCPRSGERGYKTKTLSGRVIRNLPMRLSLLRRVQRDSLVRCRRPYRARLFVEELEARTVLSVSGLTPISLAGQIVPNDPSFGQQYDMSKISAPTAGAATTGRRSYADADMDSGIDYNLPEL